MISRTKFYDNESAVSVLVGTLMMILVIVVGSMAIATIYSGLSKETNDKIGLSASVVDRGTPVYIAGSPVMTGLVQVLAKDFSKSNPTLYITTGSMDQNSSINLLYKKGIDASMYVGNPKVDPNYNAVQIGESCAVNFSSTGGIGFISPDGSQGNFMDYGLAIENGTAIYADPPDYPTPPTWNAIKITAWKAYNNQPAGSPQNTSYCYPLYLITKNDDITVKPFVDYSRSTAARDTFNSVYRTSITDL